MNIYKGNENKVEMVIIAKKFLRNGNTQEKVVIYHGVL